ncbi:hypothetical protein [Nocardia aurea]|uniref:hypothetical protein n=1 Tax=Nocardia aurea TaxID=2144174 RepID=UPI0033B323AF
MSIHAVLNPVINEVDTGSWDSGVTTLCGLLPNIASAWSMSPEHVTCPKCRAHKDFDPVRKAYDALADELGDRLDLDAELREVLGGDR